MRPLAPPASSRPAGRVLRTPTRGGPPPRAGRASAVQRLTRFLGGAAVALLAALITACADASLPTGPATPAAGRPRSDVAPLGVGRPMVSALGENLCIDIQGAGAEPGDPGKPATIYSCHGGANQQVRFEAGGEIRLYGDMCLDAAGGQGNDGDAVVLWPCHGGANQRWRFTDGGELVGVNEKCLDVLGAEPTPGSRLVLYTCHGGANQRWAVAGAGPAPDPAPTFAPNLVAAGQYHSCALAADGAAYCWGLNNSGELGNGSGQNSAVPVAVAGGRAFTQIVAGNGHTCALAADRRAWCWGYGLSGAVGDGSRVFSRPTPVAVAGGHTFASLTAGGTHTCGLTPDGAALCWGEDLFGQLGNDRPLESQSAPVAVAGGHTFRSLDAGSRVTCGVRTDGAAFCWGDGPNGNLGIDNGFVAQQATPAPVRGGLRFRTVSAGLFASCGITEAGATYCWGANYNGSTGIGEFFGYTFDPTPVVMPSGVTAFSSLRVADFGHTCALAAGDGTVYCWGLNLNGQLGDASMTSRSVPTRVADVDAYAAVSAGYSHTCGITTAGVAKCWGRNPYGELGRGAVGGRANVPAPVAGGLTFGVR